MNASSRLALASLVTVGVGLAGASGALATESAAISAYSVAAPTSVAKSGLVARAVVPAGSTCPSLIADGRAYRTSARLPASLTSPAFAPILVCERNVPAGAQSASIGGMAIPAAMPAQVHKMVLFGDTGCRIWPTAAQNCSDPTQWPLARISRRIAAEKADVVVFAGDFFYRESGCPAGYQDWCGNSPPPLDPTSPSTVSTDSAYGWMADVLVPMAPMLRTAPIVIARGNHEECGRAGNGFFLLMDPRPSTAQWCTDLAQPPTSAYPVDLPVATAAAAPARTLRLVVADSANGSDTTISAAEPSLNAMYRGAASLAAPRRGRESWLLTHRPIFALVAPSIAGSGSQWTSVDQQAASYGLLGNYRMILSSHVHLVQSMQVPGQPGQLVMGNGGTELDPSPPSLPPYTTLETTTGQPVSPAYPPYPAATGFWGTSTFGYAVATPGRRPGAWSIVQRDDSGTTFARCGVTGRTINCAGASK